ncbi:MAG TPA: dihydrolipoamide acetyltransferase family protein [Gemmataceae bacterium]|nr:dihydrolipoamide acetyltransferase family protein [Gemmataceae bacterium]
MDFKLPELGEGVYEAEMTRWLVGVGDSVSPSQGLLEVLTDKATMEVPSPFFGVIQELNVQPGAQLKVGELILRYDPLGKPAAIAEKPSSNGGHLHSSAPVVASVPSNGPVDIAVKAAPAVRQMARKLGIDLAGIRGTGPGGRILLGDLGATPPAISSNFGTPGTRIKLQGVRRKIAEHMVRAKTTIPHYTYVDECDVSDLVRVRNGLRDAFAARGVKLTYLAFIAKAVAGALAEVPMVNATFDDRTEELALQSSVDLGIAVASSAGLMVPVVRDVAGRSLFDVASEIQRVSEEARTGKARLDDLKGGGFTITSIGNIGGLFATPIINHPQVGILGVGKIVRRPVFDAQERVVAADMMYLSFSFDHRVLDGAIGAAFGNAVIKRLAKPLELAVDLG